MIAASKMAHQKYIVNVIIDADKKVVHAVAGDAIEAHAAGCKFLQDCCQVVPKKPQTSLFLPTADIHLTRICISP